jgi:hypothetical protein
MHRLSCKGKACQKALNTVFKIFMETLYGGSQVVQAIGPVSQDLCGEGDFPNAMAW